MKSFAPPAERTKPLLGTFVTVRVHGLAPTGADELLGRCFAEVAVIQSRMSFHESSSDVSKLNREAHRHPVQVDARTVEVLRLAGSISRESRGAFDITTAPQVVAACAAPRPNRAPRPDSRARWGDVVLLPDNRVGFERPLWIDLGGIAKGYAVDRVIEMLRSADVPQACVNAGGDLRVLGLQPEWVRLGVDLAVETRVPMIELCEQSIASSGGRTLQSSSSSHLHSAVAHVDGASRRRAPRRFVAVVAPTCAVADALTKVVMARGRSAGTVLRHFGAHAVMSDKSTGWREVA